ncbi:MAG: hypothetical protein QG553_280 [Patescibacteria group bacterium]|nr:hypothetical protein [Patescibacteria group bacterium]
MSTFERGRPVRLIDKSTYQQVKDACLALMGVSGVRFSENADNGVNITLSREVEAEFGVFPRLAYSVRGETKTSPSEQGEEILIVTRGYGLAPGRARQLYQRKLGMAVVGNEVTSAWTNLSLPSPEVRSEKSQAQGELHPFVREHFADWEREVVGLQTLLYPEDCQMLVAEINEIAEL